jgi:hypothetical protein
LGKNTPLYPDEALYSLMDVRTLNDPTDLFFPKPSDDLPYYYKPPLKTFMKYLVLKALGVNGFTLRFLDGVMGLLTIGVICLIGYRLFNKWVGIASAFIMLTFSGLHRDYWARVNAYDAGLVLGTTVFFYLFLFHYKKKLGWLWCGLALTFCFYYKHIMSFLILFIAFVYLLVNEGFKGVLNRRFFLMLMVIFVLILVWHIPYFLINPEAFHRFISDEIIRRIFTGYSGQRGYLNPEYVLSSIWGKTAAWNILVIPGIFIALILFLLKKKKDQLILAFWFFIPLLALIISASRLPRYMFPFYPPMALMVGYSAVTAPIELIKLRITKAKLYLVFLRYSAFLALSIFLLMTTFNAFKLTLTAIEPYRRESFHIFADLFDSQDKGKIYIAEKDISRFAWEEQVIMEFIKDRIVFLRNRQEIPAAIKGLRKTDAILLFRWELTNLIYSEKIGDLSLERDSYIDIPIKTLRYSSMRKVAIFRKDSPIAIYFKKSKIPPHHFYGRDFYNSGKDLVYISNLFNISIGSSGIDEKILRYYAEALKAGYFTREELAQRCECYSKYFNYKQMPVWSDKSDRLDYGKNGFHYLVDFYKPERQGTLFMLGITRNNMTNNMYCYFKKTEFLWKQIPGKYNIEYLLKSIHSNDVIILTRSHLFEYITELKRKLPAINDNTNSQSSVVVNSKKHVDTSRFLFFAIRTGKSNSSENTQYPSLVGIVIKDGALSDYLNAKGMHLSPLIPFER